MQARDWLSAGFNSVAGLFLGPALNGLAELVSDVAWVIAVTAGVGAALALVLSDKLISGLTDRIFPGGVPQPAHNPHTSRALTAANRLPGC